MSHSQWMIPKEESYMERVKFSKPITKATNFLFFKKNKYIKYVFNHEPQHHTLHLLYPNVFYTLSIQLKKQIFKINI